MRAAERHLTVACDICKAAIGEPCQNGTKLRGKAHPSRAKKANWEADAPARERTREFEAHAEEQRRQMEWENPNSKCLYAGCENAEPEGRVWCLIRRGDRHKEHKEEWHFHINGSGLFSGQMPHGEVAIKDTGRSFRWSVSYFYGEGAWDAGYAMTLDKAKYAAECAAIEFILGLDDTLEWKRRAVSALGGDPDKAGPAPAPRTPDEWA